jgi:hypothetical protein
MDVFEKWKFRFDIKSVNTNGTSFAPWWEITDKFDGEKFEIRIDSFTVDYHIVLDNILTEKVSKKRDEKLKSVLNEK